MFKLSIGSAGQIDASDVTPVAQGDRFGVTKKRLLDLIIVILISLLIIPLIGATCAVLLLLQGSAADHPTHSEWGKAAESSPASNFAPWSQMQTRPSSFI